MAREEIDLKSVKKLNNSGKPKKKSTMNKKFKGPQAPKSNKNAKSGKPANASSGNKNAKTGKPDSKKSDTKKSYAGKTTEKSMKKPVEKKISTVKIERVPEDWLYMNTVTDSVMAVKNACEDLKYDVEFWEDLGVIEVTIDETTSMDFEMLDDYEVEEETTDYINSHKVKLAMLVSVRAEQYGKAKDILKKISEETEGFFCVDDGKFQVLK